jgi:CRP-like cAMP-binding protein
MAVEKLNRHELFELLTPKQMERLSNSSGTVKLEEGQRICLEGAPATHLFVLLKGRVELRRPTKVGLTLLVDDLTEGGIVGVSSLMGTGRYLLNGVCVEESEVLRIEAEELRRILEENPVVGCAIQQRISQIFFKRYVETMERLQTVVQAMPIGLH